ncbi:ABC transporter permease [Catelliglobosispora koreensis]|uniref:ABC transporter permease n=1 Tax=Catelliglobosispora koreensis TaxID=129052 RepID=UPI0003817A83|nr:ABC transporter permease [Catelliglobosispora koreensis]
MFAFVIRRLLISIPVLLVASFLVFIMVTLMGDPLDALRVTNPPTPPETIALEAQRLHLDLPWYERYWHWLTNALQGDFGPSVNKTENINEEVWGRLGVTLRLVFVALAVALVLAIVTGVVSAVKQYSKMDYTATFFGFLFLAMPSFWLAILLKEAGILLNQADGDPQSRVFYTYGDRSVLLEDDSAWGRFADIAGHMILPTIALALITFASWTRFQRSSMLEVLGSDYIRLARAKGLRWRKVLTKHALRTALIPLVTVTALDFAGILGGAVITEQVFGWHGMGQYLIDSITTRDAYAVMAWLLIAGTIVVIFNLIADLLYGVLDPRIRI